MPGTPLSRKQVYRLFDKYARAAGIDSRAFPHMARATMITTTYLVAAPNMAAL